MNLIYFYNCQHINWPVAKTPMTNDFLREKEHFKNIFGQTIICPLGKEESLGMNGISSFG